MLENLTLSILAESSFPGYSLFKNHDFILASCFKVYLIRAPPTNMQSLAKDYRSFGVVCMRRQVMEILMVISRFNIQISDNLIGFKKTFKSRNAILSLLDAYVNLMSVWNALILHKKN